MLTARFVGPCTIAFGLTAGGFAAIKAFAVEQDRIIAELAAEADMNKRKT